MPTFTGTSGDDSYWGGPDADSIEGLGGNDYLLGNGGDDEIFGGDGDDNLHGGDGNDILDGGEGNDLLAGEGGIDILRGQGGDDRLLLNTYNSNTVAGASVDGGSGTDTLQFDGYSLSTAITFSIADPAVAQNIAGATIVGVEQLSFRAGSGNDDITGGALDDYIDGNDGNDTIHGGLGNDNLDGGSGADTIYGGGGNDIIRGGGNHYGLPADVLYGEDGDDIFYWNQDGLIDGGTGVDELRIEYYNSTGITADLSNPGVETMVLGTRVIGVERLTFYAGSGDDHITGGVGDDLLVGNAGDDILIGGTGNDTLSGGDGNDQLSGGAGDDFLHNYTSDTNPADLIDGGDGFDTLEFRATSATGPITIDLLATTGMVTNVEQIYFSGGSGTNNVSGGAAADTFWGGVSGDHFDGRGGDDQVQGNGGDDVILGGDGDDYLDGGDGNDSLDGGTGVDQLYGGNGADTLHGGDGNDYLYGGSGNDTLTGGSGVDNFVNTAAGFSGDTITDLQAGEKIVITDTDIGNFSFSLSGNVLTYSGGSLTLDSVPTGNLVAQAAAGGGVQLMIRAHPENDFNGDGRSDILWRSDAGGLSDWLGQANGGFVANDANAFSSVPTSWKVVGTGDFDGDGRNDVLWRSDSGQLGDWLGQANGGFTPNDGNALTAVQTDWHVVGTGDFDGDGRSDILWRNATSGELSNWLGTANGGFAVNDANAYITVPTEWTVTGTGDFNGDGKADILWTGPNREIATWFGTATGGWTINDWSVRLNTSERVIGVGDFNGDGISDLVTGTDSSGQLREYIGEAQGSWHANLSFPDDLNILHDWHVVGTGDYDGDGIADLLWRNDAGQLSDWLGQSDGNFTVNDANAFVAVPTSWQVQDQDTYL